MSQFLTPKTTNFPAQGDYSLLPQTHIAIDSDPLALQNTLNIWLANQAANPDYNLYINSVEFSATQIPGPDIQYSALVLYTKVIKI